MIVVTVDKGKLHLKDEIIGFIQRRVTPFGKGAKVGVPKEYLGHQAYVIICKKTGTKKPAKPNKKQ